MKKICSICLSILMVFTIMYSNVNTIYADTITSMLISITQENDLIRSDSDQVIFTLTSTSELSIDASQIVLSKNDESEVNIYLNQGYTLQDDTYVYTATLTNKNVSETGNYYVKEIDLYDVNCENSSVYASSDSLLDTLSSIEIQNIYECNIVSLNVNTRVLEENQELIYTATFDKPIQYFSLSLSGIDCEVESEISEDGLTAIYTVPYEDVTGEIIEVCSIYYCSYSYEKELYYDEIETYGINLEDCIAYKLNDNYNVLKNVLFAYDEDKNALNLSYTSDQNITDVSVNFKNQTNNKLINIRFEYNTETSTLYNTYYLDTINGLSDGTYTLDDLSFTYDVNDGDIVSNTVYLTSYMLDYLHITSTFTIENRGTDTNVPENCNTLLDGKNTFDLNQQWYVFTPDKSSYYYLQTSGVNKFILYELNDDTLDFMNTGSSNLMVSLDEEATYYIYVEFKDNITSSTLKLDPVTVGGNEETISVPSSYTTMSIDRNASLSSEEEMWFCFKPDEDGYYVFASNTSGNPKATLYEEENGNLVEIREGDDSDLSNSYDYYLEEYLYSGTTYFLKSEYVSYEDLNGSLTITKIEEEIQDDSPVTLTLNETNTYEITYDSSRVMYFIYTPSETNYYVLNVSPSETSHAVYVYDSDGNELSEEDALEANQTYSFEVYYYDDATYSLCLQVNTSHCEHDYEAENTISPTCTNSGYTTYKCSKCGKEKIVEEEAIGHNYGDVTYIWSSDYKTCKAIRVCLNNTKHVESETVDTTVSNQDGYLAYTATFKNEAFTTQTQVSDIAHSEHTWDEGVITKEPTCLKEGVKTYTCSVCGDTKNEAISKLGHDYSYTYTWSDDLRYCSAIATCSRCEKEVSEEVKSSFKTTQNATCTTTGMKEYTATFESSLFESQIKEEEIDALGHDYETKTILADATNKTNGSIVTSCSRCGDVSSSTFIYYPKSVTLSYTTTTYNGSYKKPTVTIKDANGKTITSSNYTLSYSNNKYVGKATIKVTFKNNYTGTLTKTFTIKPKATSISSLVKTSKAFTMKWKKVSTQCSGYQIQYSTSSKFTTYKTVNITSYKTISKTIKNLKSKKKYYVRIRTYKKVNNSKYYSSFSKIKNVTTK